MTTPSVGLILLGSAVPVSDFQRAVLRIGHYLIVLALTLVAATTAVSLARGNPVLDTLTFALVVLAAFATPDEARPDAPLGRSHARDNLSFCLKWTFSLGSAGSVRSWTLTGDARATLLP